MENKYTINYRIDSNRTNINKIRALLFSHVVDKFNNNTYSRDDYNYIKWQVMIYTGIPTGSLIIDSIE